MAAYDHVILGLSLPFGLSAPEVSEWWEDPSPPIDSRDRADSVEADPTFGAQEGLGDLHSQVLLGAESLSFTWRASSWEALRQPTGDPAILTVVRTQRTAE